jgi:hypothetical protein
VTGCWPLPLPAAELAEWMALRRVCGGGVAMAGDCYLDLGRPMPGYLDDPLDGLRRRGLAELVECPGGCYWRLTPTSEGRDRYDALSLRRGIPPPEHLPCGGDLPTGTPPRWSGPCPVPHSRQRHGADGQAVR